MSVAREIVEQVTENFTAQKAPGQETAEALRGAAKKIVNYVTREGADAQSLWDVGAFFEHFVMYPGSPLRTKYGGRELKWEMSPQDISEAVTASQFPFITSKLISSRLIPAYEENVIADELPFLVEEVESANKAEDIAGMIRAKGVDGPLLEGQKFPEGKPIEKNVRIVNHKFAEMIDFTKELMLFDKTGGQIMRDAIDHGEAGGSFLRQWIFEVIIDGPVTATGQAAGAVFSYKGTAGAVFQNDHTALDARVNDNIITTALGTTGISDALQKFAAMVNFHGQSVRVRPEVLIVSSKKLITAEQQMNSPADPDGTHAAVTNVVRSRRLVQRVITDPVLDNDDANYWYFGVPRKQYRLQWVWRPLVVDMGPDKTRDVVQSVGFSFMCGIGPTDYVYVIQSQAAS